MSWRRTRSTAARILRQLRHDPRTVALLLLVPTVLMALLAWILDSIPNAFDRYGVQLLGIFPFIVMFLVTSVATLRERTSGTLERLLAMPLGRGDFIGGYGVAFGLAAALQALIVAGVSVGLLGLDVQGPLWSLLLLAVLVAVVGTSIGLFLSAFATTEFQAVQFMPAVVLPQLLLCGIIVPRDQLPRPLELLSDVLPLSYAVDASKQVATQVSVTHDYVTDIAILLVFTVVGLVAGSLTLRRTTA